MVRFFYFVLIALAAYAQSAAADEVYVLDAAQSTLTFEVDSTLHKVHGTADISDAKINLDRLSGEAAMPFKVVIPSASTDTAHGKRDTAMRKMLESDKYPEIIWEAESVNCDISDTSGAAVCQADGMLTIRNITKPSSFEVVLSMTDDAISAAGNWTLNRDDFELKTPSVLGIIRVDKEITINFETYWAKEVSV